MTSTSRTTGETESHETFDSLSGRVVSRRRLVSNRSNREKRGLCPTCGTKLYKTGRFGNKKTPLTVEGKVMEGRCLTCDPIEKEVVSAASAAEDDDDFEEEPCFEDGVPRVLTVERRSGLHRYASDDNMTLVSNITLDHRLLPGEESERTGTADEALLHRQHEQLARITNCRPGASQDGDEHERPQLPRRSPPRENHRAFSAELKRDRIPAPPTGVRSSSSIEYTVACDLEEEEKVEIDAEPCATFPSKDSQASEPSEIVLEPSDFHSASSQQQVEIQVDPESLPITSATDSDVEEEEEEYEETEEEYISSSSSERAIGSIISGRTKESSRGMVRIESIPEYLRQLAVDGLDQEAYVASLDALSWAIWVHGPPAKKAFVQHQGMESLTKIMWDDISNHVIQEASLELLLSLVASQDADVKHDVFIGEAAAGCVDVLLICMQTLLENDGVQEIGCRILCCLASASFNNPDVNDGSLSGAVAAVLNAMEAHQQSLEIQECGIRALYQQCALSMNAESNKRALAKRSTVLLVALDKASSDPLLAERLCMLYWCLSSNEDVAEMLGPAAAPMNKILAIARKYRKKKESVILLEAALGSIANFSNFEHNHGVVDAGEAIALALDIMRFSKDSGGVVIEACRVVANLSSSIGKVVESGGLRTILRAMIAHSDDSNLCEEALRALVCLCSRSSGARDALFDPDLYSHIMELKRVHANSISCQALTCRLLSLMYQGKSTKRAILLADITDVVCTTMILHPDSEPVQDAGCSALRVASYEKESAQALQENKAINLIVAAMEKHRHSKSIQLNCCAILCYMASVLEPENMAVESIIHVIQNHAETCSVVEVACRCLWRLIHGSDRLKRRLLKTDGIDAVTCVLVMHPDKPSLLEKAVGLLSSMTACRSLAKHVVSTQRVGCIVEAMRSNIESVALLTSCTLFLRNAIVALPEHAADANDAISLVLNAMTKYPEDVDFQREACSFLWVVTAVSRDSKSKTLALDGISILMETLENTEDPDVQEVALGAFNELALTSSGS